jgi:glycosyltransferase involved in cell wall biosynthesis
VGQQVGAVLKNTMPGAPRASVVITTKNRREELKRALNSAVRQSVGIEVLVVDDGSNDGTAEMVRKEFPNVALHARYESRGYIVRRNEAARLATGSIIVSIDDDAEFSTSFVVEQTLADFDHPRIGAVAMPFVEPLESKAVLQRAPDRSACFVTDSYIGTAHAIRRDIFLGLGGYRELLVHQGEERDYCLRMLASGYVVKLGSADPIHHFDSARRSFKRMDFYGRRNDILFAVHNVPMPHLPIHLIGTTLNGLSFALRCGRPADQLHGIGAGYLEGLRRWGERQPVSAVIYRLQRLLRKAGPCPLERIENKLPACVLSP